MVALASLVLSACSGKSTDVRATCKADLDINVGFAKFFQAIPPQKGNGPPPDSAKPQIQASFDANLSGPFAAVKKDPPAAIKKEINEVLPAYRRLRTGDFSALDDKSLHVKTAKIEQYLFDNCNDGRSSVTAVDYDFKNTPSNLDHGVFRFRLQNSGTEHHQMILFTRKSGETDPFDDILKLGEEGSRAKLNEIGEADARPGEKDFFAADLPAGDYLLICAVPKGSTGEKMGDGPPHFTLGMKREFKVF